MPEPEKIRVQLGVGSFSACLYIQSLFALALIPIYYLGVWTLFTKQMASTSNVPNLASLIGDIQYIKDDSEGMAFAVKQRWSQHVITDLNSRDCADYYRELAAAFNSITATLEALQSTGDDKVAIDRLKTDLAEAQNRYIQFRNWFNALPRGHKENKPHAPGDSGGPTSYEGLPEITPQVVDISSTIFTSIQANEARKRDHLIDMLQRVRFKTWPEIPAVIPIPSGN